MRKAGLTLLSSLFFTSLFIYITTILSPWDNQAVENVIKTYKLITAKDFNTFVDEVISMGLIWELLNIKNVVIWFILFGLAFCTAFAGIHLLIDKLFFKPYKEEANIFDAFRRAVLVFLFIISIVILRLLSGLLWYNILGLVILIAALEYIFYTYSRNNTLQEKSNT